MDELDESMDKKEVDLEEWTESDLTLPEDMVKGFRYLGVKHTALKLKEYAIQGLYDELSDTHVELWAALEEKLKLNRSINAYRVINGKLYYRKKRSYER